MGVNELTKKDSTTPRGAVTPYFVQLGARGKLPFLKRRRCSNLRRKSRDIYPRTSGTRRRVKSVANFFIRTFSTPAPYFSNHSFLVDAAGSRSIEHKLCLILQREERKKEVWQNKGIEYTHTAYPGVRLNGIA